MLTKEDFKAEEVIYPDRIIEIPKGFKNGKLEYEYIILYWGTKIEVLGATNLKCAIADYQLFNFGFDGFKSVDKDHYVGVLRANIVINKNVRPINNK